MFCRKSEIISRQNRSFVNTIIRDKNDLILAFFYLESKQVFILMTHSLEIWRLSEIGFRFLAQKKSTYYFVYHHKLLVENIIVMKLPKIRPIVAILELPIGHFCEAYNFNAPKNWAMYYLFFYYLLTLLLKKMISSFYYKRVFYGPF